MLFLATTLGAAYTPTPRPAAERSLSSLRGYASEYWRNADYAFVGREAMASSWDSVEAFVARFEAEVPAPATQNSLEQQVSRVPGWSVAGASGSSVQPDYGKIAAAAAVAGMTLAYSSGASMGMDAMGMLDAGSMPQQAKQAMSAAKAAIPDYGGIAMATAAAANPAMGKLASSMGRVKPRAA